MGQQAVLIAVILLYGATLAALGLLLSRRVRSPGDFFVAGRNLSSPLLFGTFLAANLGAGTTVGAAQLGYESGLSAWWWVGSAGLGSLILAFAVGPRVHRIARENGLYTVGDYLDLRYNKTVRLLTATLLWLGSLAILAGQLIAIGFVLNVAAGVPQVWGVVAGGAIVTIYFSAGGLWGAAWINLLQAGVKAAGFCLAAPFALSLVGGWQGLAERAGQSAGAPGGYLSIVGIGFEGIVGYAAILIPSFIVSPGLIQKLYGARDEGVIRRAVGLQGLTLLAYSFLPVLLGMAAFVLHPDLPDPGLALPRLLADDFPPLLGGLMLAAILSAEISSADAVLFMLSTSWAKDIVQTLVGRPANDAALLGWARLAAVAGGALGTLLAASLQSVIAALTVFYTLLTVTLFMPLLAGLFSRKAGAKTALASIAAAVPAMLAVHLATAGAGWGPLTPAVCGILVSAAAFALAYLPGRRTPTPV